METLLGNNPDFDSTNSASSPGTLSLEVGTEVARSVVHDLTAGAAPVRPLFSV